MRICIKHDWGTSIENGLVHYILLGVEGGVAERLHVGVEDSVHERLHPEPFEAVRSITERFILVLLERLVGLGEAGMSGLLTTANGRLGYRLDLRLDDANEPKRLSALKECQYRYLERGDSYCAAAVFPPEQAGACPTTSFRCSTCAMPDARVACVHLHHPRIGHMDEAPTFGGAECDRGRGEVAEPFKCRPGENQCWECSVPFSVEPVVVSSPLALHEQLDFLDAVWRNVFGKSLLRMRALSVAGKLATPCESQQDFEVKLSALADIMNSFDVPDGLLTDADREAKSFEKGHTLDRLVSALQRRLAEDGKAELEASAKEHVNVLRDALGLRRSCP